MNSWPRPPYPLLPEHINRDSNADLELQFNGNRLLEIIRKFLCPQKILMVTDSSLDFGTGGFGFPEFVTIITSAEHTVATAHRNRSGPNLTIADNFNW